MGFKRIEDVHDYIEFLKSDSLSGISEQIDSQLAIFSEKRPEVKEWFNAIISKGLSENYTKHLFFFLIRSQTTVPGNVFDDTREKYDELLSLKELLEKCSAPVEALLAHGNTVYSSVDYLQYLHVQNMISDLEHYLSVSVNTGQGSKFLPQIHGCVAILSWELYLLNFSKDEITKLVQLLISPNEKPMKKSNVVTRISTAIKMSGNHFIEYMGIKHPYY